ncbi:MAG: nucleoside-diphosphate kinase [Candidatus Falkowbacteria bacterium]
MEKTFVLIKTDASGNQQKIKKIIKMLENIKQQIIHRKYVQANREMILRHYDKPKEWYVKNGQRIYVDLIKAGKPTPKTPFEYGQEIMERIIKYMTRKPMIALILEGPDAVNLVRLFAGDTEPINARIHTIRFALSDDSYAKANRQQRALHNVIHCSETAEDVEREIAIWFPEL